MTVPVEKEYLRRRGFSTFNLDGVSKCAIHVSILSCFSLTCMKIIRPFSVIVFLLLNLTFFFINPYRRSSEFVSIDKQETWVHDDDDDDHTGGV